MNSEDIPTYFIQIELSVGQGKQVTINLAPHNASNRVCSSLAHGEIAFLLLLEKWDSLLHTITH